MARTADILSAGSFLFGGCSPDFVGARWYVSRAGRLRDDSRLTNLDPRSSAGSFFYFMVAHPDFVGMSLRCVWRESPFERQSLAGFRAHRESG